MFKVLGKFWSAALVLTLAVFGLVAIPSEHEPAVALDGSKFNPGLIISDSVFYDFGTMKVADIQRFLDARVAICRAAADRPGCLKDYRISHPAVTGSAGRCESLPAKNNITAAELIHDVARACGINPRVILVKLQKEQGLVTSTDPSPRAYDFALGMDCPDSPSGCSAASAGFFWQLYKGAGQLKWYNNPAGSFTWLRPGTVISRPYYPNSSSCGSLSFRLENKATAALYYYTPYVPNEAALRNLYSTGDSCSSYGNRNFWRFFSDWFGSPIGGGFLLKAAKGKTFLIVDEVKYRIPNAELRKSLSPLGPVGVISRDYLDSFPTVGEMTPLIRNGTTDRYFFVDAGKRIRFESCDQVQDFGLSCDSAVTLTGPQFTALEAGGDVTNLIIGADNERFIVQAGQLREVLDDASAAEAGIPLTSPSAIRMSSLSNLSIGKPIAANGSLAVNRQTGVQGVIAEDTFFAIDKDTAKDIDFSVWLSGQGATLGGPSIETLAKGRVIQSIVASAAGEQYLLTPSGKRLIQDTENWIKNPPVLPESILEKIPTSSEELITPAVVRSTTNSTLFLVANGLLRPIQTVDRKAVRASLPDPTVHRISPSALNQIRKGSQVIPPGALVRIANTNRSFLVDGLNRLYRIPNAAQASSLGLGAARTVSKADLSSYVRSGKLAGVRVRCNGQPHIVVSGKLIPVSEATYSHYPTASRDLSAGTCATLSFSTETGSRFIRTSDKKFFLIEQGKKRPIASRAQYLKLRGSGASFIAVDNAFASRFTTGTNVAPDTGEIADDLASASLNSLSVLGLATKSYTVKMGDTLSAIATQFGTTVSRLVELNSIQDANLLYIGQVLKLP